LKHWTAAEAQPVYNVTFVDSGTVSKEHNITLSRATYKLPKEKADALAAFLKHVKASVLETKVEDDGVTVTTTPDVQHTIAQLVGLLTGQPHAASGLADGQRLFAHGPHDLPTSRGLAVRRGDALPIVL